MVGCTLEAVVEGAAQPFVGKGDRNDPLEAAGVQSPQGREEVTRRLAQIACLREHLDGGELRITLPRIVDRRGTTIAIPINAPSA